MPQDTPDWSSILQPTYLGAAPGGGGFPNPNTTRITVPSNIVFLALLLVNQPPSAFARIQAIGNQVSGVLYCSYYKVTQPAVFFPFFGSRDPSVDITLQSANANQVGVNVVGYTAEPPSLYRSWAPPWLRPNQAPAVGTAGSAARTLISPVANQTVYVFKITEVGYSDAVSDAAIVSSGTAVGAYDNTLASLRLKQNLISQAQFDLTGPEGAIALPAGDGVFTQAMAGASPAVDVTVVYSLG